MEVNGGRLRGIRASCFDLHVVSFHIFIPSHPMMGVPIKTEAPSHVPRMIRSYSLKKKKKKE